MNKPRFLLGLLLLVAVLVWTAFFIWPSENLKITFCDVGQGDAIFVKSPSNFQMLIDGGPSNAVLSCLAESMPFWDKSINLVILSHPHSDHLTGLIEVLKRYNVEQILSTDAIHTSPEFLEWLKIIREKNIPVELSKDVKMIDLGSGAKAAVLYPKTSFKDKRIDNLNDTSIVLKLDYAGISFLFPGDLEKEWQNKIPLNQVLQPITFLKVPHHGAKDALDDNFLSKIRPKLAIISVGKNSYGQPAKETLSKLSKVNALIHRTDQEGSIVVIVNKDGSYVLSTFSKKNFDRN